MPDRRVLLLLPLLACAADVALTLFGQPAAYWAGERSAVLELNPAARWMLLRHPMVFVVAGSVSSLVVAAVVLRASPPLAWGVSLVVTIGHSIAAAAWLARMGPLGWAGAVVILLAVRAALPPRPQTAP